VRDLTIAYHVELLHVSITRKGSDSTTSNMSGASASAEKFPGREGNRKKTEIAKKDRKMAKKDRKIAKKTKK